MVKGTIQTNSAKISHTVSWYRRFSSWYLKKKNSFSWLRKHLTKKVYNEHYSESANFC